MPCRQAVPSSANNSRICARNRGHLIRETDITWREFSSVTDRTPVTLNGWQRTMADVRLTAPVASTGAISVVRRIVPWYCGTSNWLLVDKLIPPPPAEALIFHHGAVLIRNSQRRFPLPVERLTAGLKAHGSNSWQFITPAPGSARQRSKYTGAMIRTCAMA